MSEEIVESIQVGSWLSIGSPVIAELAAECGLDWVLIDLEHGSGSEATVPDQLRSLRGSGTRGIVRVGAAHADLIARILDWGADGVMVPHVESASQAEGIVAAARYPPRGRRGVSRTVRAYGYGLRLPSDGLLGSAGRPTILAQVETAEGVRAAPQIAEVEGIDVLFVGPADLRFDLEHHPAEGGMSYDECLSRVVEAARAAGKAAGILVRDLDDLESLRRRGFTSIAIDSDLAILRRAYQGVRKC